jgi:hypothetical protein
MEAPREQNQSRVALVATVHQPNEALGELIRATLPQLQALYGELVFLCSQRPLPRFWIYCRPSVTC